MDEERRKKMKAFFDLVVGEAEKNEEFAAALAKIFGEETEKIKTNESTGTKRASNRRDKPVLDPIRLAEDDALSAENLLPLTVKELKDIIAGFGMDPAKLAMKWKDKDRLIQLIIETSYRRAAKGNVFRV